MKGGYDFEYRPVPTAAPDDDGSNTELVVATAEPIEATSLVEALEPRVGVAEAVTLIARPPLYWTLVRLRSGRRRCHVAQALHRAGVPLRYVASARRQSMELPPQLSFDKVAAAKPKQWRARRPGASLVEPSRDARWFLSREGGGIGVDRALCGTGAGSRLAVIDDDAADFEQLDLDAVVDVRTGHVARASGHGALLIGWAVGAKTYGGNRFLGVAPDASVRAYLIPRPGDDVISLPLAIARAAVDGADVILCATYVEGTNSPMLDDALEFASHRGRGGRGCAVVFPTGRETSSPEGSMHASLSLSFGDPASDPRVFCIAPGGRDGGWFLWRARKGKLRPFANRGPAARWLAPGDDLVHPFLGSERAFHAESSGASAVAAGVLLLVLSRNGSLGSTELADVVTRCTRAPMPTPPEARAVLADPADVSPSGRDRDGHDAKHGYGRLDASSSCVAAEDPIALELMSMGADEAALRWCERRRTCHALRAAYSPAFARWAARFLLGDATAEHALRSILRHMRLLAADPQRARGHAPGAIARHLVVLLRAASRSRMQRPPAVRQELAALDGKLRAATREGVGAPLEEMLVVVAGEVFFEAKAASAGTCAAHAVGANIEAAPSSAA
jgi:hypothetical protein